MRITVRLFATLRDRAGREQITLDLPEPADVTALLTRLAADFPALEPSLSTVLIAINHEYAFPEDVLTPGDEVALFPPVSGGDGSTPWPEYFAVTQDPLDIDRIVAHITRPETGATYVFVGAVRGLTRQESHIRNTDHLVYEAYEPMAEQKLHQIAAEIRERYPGIQGIAIVQRIGKLEVGDTTVLVACSAGHRNDGCLEAAHYGIDRLKEIVPVWKKEVSPDGSMWVEGHYHPTPDDVRPAGSTPVTNDQPSADSLFTLGCPECAKRYPWDSRLLHCSCGHAFEVAHPPVFDEGLIDQREASMWRYRAMLAPSHVQSNTLGEGWTPLISINDLGRDIRLKLENLNPTGSFKDRGASLLTSILKHQGVERVHDDSSGNAGAALAAYAARAGLAAQVFSPGSVSPNKRAQIRLYGATLTAVDGSRPAAAQAAREAADGGHSYYASHVFNPFAVLAYKSLAYELWEQMGYVAPDIVIIPVGHGTQLLGMARGFQDLLTTGHIDHLPRLVGVQAQACAPIWHQFQQGTTASYPAGENLTLAEGVEIINPIRGKQVLKAITVSGGEVVAVSEDEIRLGVHELAHHGILAEPTSAIVWPALKHIATRTPAHLSIVLSITGSGLKAPDLQRFA
jgi:threonine synthase/molybdopterin converting factor subunit 1